MIGDKVLETGRTTPESLDLHKLLYDMEEGGATHVIMEVSSHALQLKRVAGINFEVGAFTNLTRDHLDFHKTFEAYCDAKAILFKNCKICCFFVVFCIVLYALKSYNKTIGFVLC